MLSPYSCSKDNVPSVKAWMENSLMDRACPVPPSPLLSPVPAAPSPAGWWEMPHQKHSSHRAKHSGDWEKCRLQLFLVGFAFFPAEVKGTEKPRCSLWSGLFPKTRAVAGCSITLSSGKVGSAPPAMNSTPSGCRSSWNY